MKLRPEEEHLEPFRRKFGFDAMIEKMRIRKDLEEKGKSGMQLFFEVERIYNENHKNDPSFRERQAGAKPTQAPIGVWLTRDEAEYLINRLAGVNDPVGMQIVEKALDSLGKREG